MGWKGKAERVFDAVRKNFPVPRVWGAFRGKGGRPGQGPAGAPAAAASVGVVEPEAPRAARVRWAEAVEAARREWQGCKAYFNCVEDPELVDHAIFAVQAAERKYMYLLRRARLAGVALDEPAGPDGPEGL